jgi:hypothetical protein
MKFQRTSCTPIVVVVCSLFILLSFAGTLVSAQTNAVNATPANANPAPVVDLVPNGYVELQFPQLPDTFYTMKTGKKVPAQVTAHLPTNYSKDGKFPLFVFLAGGDGGNIDHNSGGGTRLMIGDTDYICVALPLFKKSIDPHKTGGDVISSDAQSGIPPALLAMVKGMSASGVVTQDDYDVISSSYATMLGKLFQTIPNIDPDRSVMVGFSNGAHTIGVLLAGKDPFVLGHFHSFCMVEGGMMLTMAPQKTLTPELKNHRYLFLLGDGAGQTGWGSAARPIIAMMEKNFVQQATAYGLDWSLVPMQNTGHTFSPTYYPIVKQWAMGGSAEGAAASAVAPAATPAPASAPQASGTTPSPTPAATP